MAADAVTNLVTEERKLFVGGISWDSTEESMRKYFQQFGEVTEVIVKRHDSGDARGFGFVTFGSSKGMAAAMKPEVASGHVIDGRKVDVKVAIVKEQQQAMKVRTKKIYVGGVPPIVLKKPIKDYFEQFGEVDEMVTLEDQNKKQRRGFLFVVFKSEDSVERCLEKSLHVIENHQVEVRRAREDRGKGRGRGQRRGGGRRGGRGATYYGAASYGGGGGSYGEAYVGGAHDSGCGYKASYGGQWDQTYQGYGSEVTYDQTSGDNYYYGSAAADSSTNGYSGYSEEPPVGGYAEGSGGYGSFRGGSRGSGGRGTHGAVRGQGEESRYGPVKCSYSYSSDSTYHPYSR